MNVTSAPPLKHLKPPVATRKEHREIRHGEIVNDEYHWLREKTNPEVIEYLEAENHYTEFVTEPLKAFTDALYQEMLSHIQQTDLSVPIRRGNYLYYSRTKEGKQYPIECRHKPSEDATEEVLLDLNVMAQGLPFLSLGDSEVSDDGDLLAYTTDTTGYRQYTLHVKDLRTGNVRSGLAERVTSISWAADNQTIFYTTEDEVTKRSDKLHRRVLALDSPQEIFEETDELYDISVHRSRDQKYIFVESRAVDSTEWRYLRADQTQRSFQTVLPRQRDHKYDVEHRDEVFFIRTNLGAKNYRVVTAPVSDPSVENWREFLPHKPDVLIDNVALFRDHAAVHEKSDALDRLRIFSFNTGQWTSIAFPEPVYAAYPGANPEADTTVFRYVYQSLVTPPSVFEYDMQTGVSTLRKRQQVPGYRQDDYATEREWATARDGTRIPISLVYKKNVTRDATAPMLLYGYGSYGLAMPPTFSSSRLVLLDRGMIFAIAHIRGGDELGETWHDDGMLMKKKNTFTDFIDCAEHLIRERWTSSDRLATDGRSAGGLLMGAVVNMRPDLFRAVHAGVPFVDVMNTMMDSTLPLTTHEYLEWGNPNEKASYDYMRSYSPYDNLERQAYPAMLVTAGLNDSQVMYWEGAKYIARMRSLKTDDNPLLLKTNMSAGHGGASGRYDRLKEQAFEYAWMLNELGLANEVTERDLRSVRA
jgi:oligopeptidase B